jgi:hypothetical protein
MPQDNRHCVRDLKGGPTKYVSEAVLLLSTLSGLKNFETKYFVALEPEMII